MCTSRYGIEGLKTIAAQSVACATPSRISKPAGVCIQLFSTRIQNADMRGAEGHQHGGRGVHAFADTGRCRTA